MPAVALTDHGNMFGAIEFYNKARAAGIKPIIGMEAYVAQGSRLDRTPGRGSSNHLVLLAKNETGYRNLLKLTSPAFLEGFYYKPRDRQGAAAPAQRGLICLSACLKGEVNEHIVATREREAEAAREGVPGHLRRGELLPRDAGPRHPRAAAGQRGGAPDQPAHRHPARRHQRLPLPAQGRRLRPRRAALHRHAEDLLATRTA